MPKYIPLTDELDTVNYYNKNTQNYIDRTFQVEMKESYERFLRHIPLNARILDAGCGPGRDALAFFKMGYKVLAFDASEEMIKYVRKTFQIPTMQGFFQEIEFIEKFDGIWASASLVHVLPNQLADVFQRFWKALKPKGVISFSVKEGEGIKKEAKRIFNYINKDTLSEYLKDFIILDQWQHTSLPGVNLKPCQWLNTIVQKKDRT